MIDVNRIIRIVQVKLFAIVLMICIAINSLAQDQFTHIATRDNRSCNGDCTMLDNSQLNGNPNAIIYVTPAIENEPHLIGLFYFKNRWNIMNLDQKVLPPGSRFNVSYVTKADPNHFLYSFKLKDIQKDGTAFIDHPALNDRPNIQVNYFVCWMPEINKGIPNRDEVQLQFNREAGRWHLTNVNKKPLYQQLAYNIIISNADKINAGGIIIPETDKPVIKKNEAGIIIPDAGIPIDRKNEKGIIIPDVGKPLDNNDVLLKKIIPPKYDFSKIQVCIEEITNKSLPPKTPVIPKPVIPKINSNGVLQPVTTVTQPLSVATNLMWSQGESISVGFLPGETWTVINKVKQYAKEWETHANIKFVFVNNVSQATIKVGFKKDGTSWSWMGRDALVNASSGKTMNLGWLDDNTAESEFRRVVLHEFGHVLGFIHEHQSPNAGIPWDKEKVYSFYGGEPNKWSRETVDIQLFQKYSATSTNSSTYDKFSIMHYSFPAALTTDSSSVPDNTELSATDKAFAGQVYPYPPGPTTLTGVLQTGDDCDEIEFKVEYNVVNSNEIAFFLEPGRDRNNNILTWWKKIGIPVIGNGEVGIAIQDGYSATKKVLANLIDKTRGIAFGKAKILGVHTGLAFTWNVWPAIIGGCRVTFVWRRDSCN